MATINDVAKLAGVSRGTVSNVINNVKVREESYIAVKKAIEELGYVPNQYARALKTNKTNTIALILPTIWNPFFSELTFYVEKEARKKGYKLLLCNSNDDYKIELMYIAMAKENKVDGIISITYSDIEAYISSNIPIVTLERYFGDDTPFITSDNISGGRMAAEKLVEAGCKKITCIGRSSIKNIGVKERAVGFKNYCDENNISYDVFYSNNPDEIKENFDKWVEKYLEENFSKEKKEARHNSKYWKNAEYVGIGLGASGYLEGIRYKNKMKFIDYYDSILIGEKPILEEEKVDSDMSEEYRHILGLRLLEKGIIPSKEEKYLKIYEKLESEGFIELKNGRYILTKKGIFLANDVFEKLI